MPDVPSVNPDAPAGIPESEASKEVWIDPLFEETRLTDEPEAAPPAEQAPAETEATAEQLQALVDDDSEPPAEEAEEPADATAATTEAAREAEQAKEEEPPADGEEPPDEPRLTRRERRARDPEVRRRAQDKIASLEATVEAQGKLLTGIAAGAASPPAADAEEAPGAEEAAPAPRLEDYDYDTSAWSEALTSWTETRLNAESEKAEKARTEDAERESAARHQQALTTFRDREEAARERHDDYDELVYDEDLPVHAAAAAMIFEAEAGPEIAYYLASNPDEAAKIAAMSDARAALAIGRIEARVLAEQAAPASEPDETETPPAEQAEAAEEAPQQRPPQPRRAPTTQAPEPIPTVLGGGAAVTRDPSKMSMDEYREGRLSGKIK